MFEMLVDSEIQQLPVSKRYVVYAKAYRTASMTFCQKMVEDPSSRNWPNSAVVLMLAAHATELFLKGAICHRDPQADVGSHNINNLATTYAKLYPESACAWEIPFMVEFPGGIKGEEAPPLSSILYRFPIQKNGQEWNAVLGLDPAEFLPVLEQMGNDFVRIESQLD